jgi:hypothetical protein
MFGLDGRLASTIPRGEVRATRAARAGIGNKDDLHGGAFHIVGITAELAIDAMKRGTATE